MCAARESKLLQSALGQFFTLTKQGGVLGPLISFPGIRRGAAKGVVEFLLLPLGAWPGLVDGGALSSFAAVLDDESRVSLLMDHWLLGWCLKLFAVAAAN